MSTSLSLHSLTNGSPWIVMPLGILLFVLLALAVSACVHRLQGPRWQDAFKTMLPPICASLMVAYGIFTVIVANTEWHDYEDADRTRHAEVYTLQQLAQHLPETGQARTLLSTYTASVARDEWPRMADDQMHPETTDALLALRRWVLAPDVAYTSPHEHALVLHLVRELDRLREHRLTLAGQSIPGVLWAALLISAITVLMAVAMVHAHNRRSSNLIAGLYGVVMGTILMTIVLLDQPYAGAIKVLPIGIDAAQDHR